MRRHFAQSRAGYEGNDRDRGGVIVCCAADILGSAEIMQTSGTV